MAFYEQLGIILAEGGGGGAEYDIPNLLVGLNWTDGYIINSSGVISENSNYRYSDFIEVDTELSFLIFTKTSTGANNGSVRVIGYDSNGDFTSALLDSTYARNRTIGVSITIPSGTTKIRITCETLGKNNMNLFTQEFNNY